MNEDDAIKVWNRRHDTSELITLRAQLAEATARAEKAEADRHWLIGQIENQTIVLNKYNANEKMLIEKLHNVSAELERMREAIGTLMVDRLPYVDESGKIEIPLMKWGEFLAALDRAALTAPEKLSCDTCGDIVCKRDRENPKVVCPDYAVTAAPEKREVCRWRPVHDGLLYKSGCEKYWSCEESISPIEAGMKYCSYCGLPIVEEKE